MYVYVPVFLVSISEGTTLYIRCSNEVQTLALFAGTQYLDEL